MLNWLEVIGQEQDPASIWVNEKVEVLTNNLLRLSYEQSPALTQVFINVLVITGGLVSATFNLMDEASGQIVSRSWNSLDENTRNRIKGGEKVVSAVLLPLGLGKKTLEVTDHVLKTLKKNHRPAPLKNDPYHADAVEDRRTQWQEHYETYENTEQRPERMPSTTSGGLDVHEVAGGHLLDKHVGESREYLEERILSEGLPAASTFDDLKSAELAISEIISLKKQQIDEFLTSSEKKIAFERVSVSQYVGRVLKNTGEYLATSKVTIVILTLPARLGEGS